MEILLIFCFSIKKIGDNTIAAIDILTLNISETIHYRTIITVKCQ